MHEGEDRGEFVSLITSYSLRANHGLCASLRMVSSPESQAVTGDRVTEEDSSDNCKQESKGPPGRSAVGSQFIYFWLR